MFLYVAAVTFFANLTGNVERIIFVSEIQYNFTMFAFLRATQSLGCLARQEARVTSEDLMELLVLVSRLEQLTRSLYTR